MSTMPNLQQYLFNVRDLELSCYKQRKYISNLNGMLKQANNPKLFATEQHQKNESDFFSVLFTALGVGFFVGIAGLVAGAVIGIIALLLFKFDDDYFSLFPLGLGLIGALVGIIGSIGADLSNKKKIIKANTIIDKKNNSIMLKNREIAAKAREQADILNDEIRKARQQLQSTEDALSQYYYKGVIYEKYQNLVPITMFCEYFASGRCNSLTGHEGAYNIYENEIRLNLIVVKLDEVINRLDQIKENQYMLANMIQEGNREIKTLASAASNQTELLQRIEASSEATSYYSGITAANTSYLSWLAYNNQIHK